MSTHAAPHDELLTPQEAAALVKVSRSRVYAWIASGLVEVIRTPGGSPRVVRASLLRGQVA